MEKLDPWASEEITESDYGHLFREFGIKRFDTLKYPIDHHFFRRNIVIAHRDFDKIFDRMEKGSDFINMTAIASSGPLHFGHKMMVDMARIFKDAGAKNYIGIADIDGFVSRPDKKVPSMKAAKENAVDNLTDILALGMKPKDVYVQSNYKPRYYELSYELSKKITENNYRAIYGEMNLGKISAVLLQMADILHPQLKEFEGKMPSVTAVGLDQDPHMRLVRDLAHKLPYDMFAPGSIYFAHQSGLKEGKKMSASEPDTAIFLKDEPKVADKKIKRAFTGGRETQEEQKKLGGRPEICKVYEMIKYHHPEDAFVEDIFEKCRSGDRLCGECKLRCSEYFQGFLEKHHKNRDKVKSKAKDIMGL